MGFTPGIGPKGPAAHPTSGTAPSSFKLGTGPGIGSSAPIKKSGGGGFFHDVLHNPVTHVVGQTVTDLKNAAVNAPAGVYQIGKAFGQDVAEQTVHPLRQNQGHRTLGLLGGMAKAVEQDFKHPLRHPGNTLLDVLPVIGAVGKAAEVGRIAKVEGVGEAAKSLTSKRVPPPRVTSAKGVTARFGNYSQAPATRFAQRYIDQIREKFPDKRIGVLTHTQRVGRALEKQRQVEFKLATAPATGLKVAGKAVKQNSPEGIALRAYAENTHPDLMQKTWRQDLTTAKSATARKNLKQKIALAEKAKPLVTLDKAGDVQIVDPKLAALAQKTESVAKATDQSMLKNELMPAETVAGSISKPGQQYRGQTEAAPEYAKPKPVSDADVAKLQKDSEAFIAKVKAAGGVKDYNQLASLDFAEKVAADANRARSYLESRASIMAGHKKVAPDLFQGGRFHVGYERRNKPFAATKEPRVGNANTVGIPNKPGRFRQSTFTNLHEGAFRNDVPSLVADNAIETERYAALLRARKFFTDNAQASPEGMRNPVAVRTDEIGRQPFDRVIKDFQDQQRQVRQAADHRFNPMGVGYDKVREEIFPQVDPADFAEHPEVKWIEEPLLGGLNKPGPLATAMQYKSVRGTMRAADAINNAQKFAILYLKPAYAVPNMVGNGFLNLVQQGFAAPANLTRSARLAHKIGPEDAALIHDLMGEGIGSSLESKSGVTSKLNNLAARKVFEPLVDTPFRLASFLYEARRELGLHGTMNSADWQKVHSLLHDEKLRPQLHDVVGRANKAIIDYGDLTPVEQAIIRRIVFFYPWLKGSARYAGQFLADHPFLAGAVGQAGQAGQKFSQDQLGPLPSWAEGYFRTGGSQFQPQIVNPTSAGILNQPAQIAEAVNEFLSSPNPRSAYTLGSFLTPAIGAANSTLAGKDQFTGKNIPQNASTFIEQALGFNPEHPLRNASLPALLLASRLMNNQSGRTFPLTDKQAVLQFLFGGVAPKNANRFKLNQAAANEQKPLRP